MLNQLYADNLQPADEDTTGYDIQYMVFGGAGVLGTAYAGVYQSMCSLDITPQIKYWAGTSAGSLAATFGAMKASPEYLKKLLQHTNLDQIVNDKPSGIIRSLQSTKDMYLKYGSNSGKNFVQWVEKSFSDIGYSPDLTFSQLYNITGNHLLITASCVNTGQPIYFTRASNPDARIIDVIRASISIPYIFQPTIMTDPYIPEKKRVLVDGAILDSYPLHVCDAIGVDGQPVAYNRYAVGCFPIQHSKNKYTPITGFLNYSGSIYQHVNDQLHIQRSRQPLYWQRSIGIQISDIQATQWNITQSQKESLYNQGYTESLQYFNHRRHMIEHYGHLPKNKFIRAIDGLSEDSDELLKWSLFYQTNYQDINFNKYL